jgi:hypothetical protein
MLNLEWRYETLGGAVSYQDLAHGEPSWSLIPSLHALVMGSGGSKLTAWMQDPTTKPLANCPPLEQVYLDVNVIGDDYIHAQIARVLFRLPAPVRDYAMSRITFLCVGMSTLGFCGARPGVGDRPWVIVLSAAKKTQASIQELIAHEIAHAWSLEEPAPNVVAAPAFWQRSIREPPRADDSPAARAVIEKERAEAARDERLADRLVDCWGFNNGLLRSAL